LLGSLPVRVRTADRQAENQEVPFPSNMLISNMLCLIIRGSLFLKREHDTKNGNHKLVVWYREVVPSIVEG